MRHLGGGRGGRGRPGGEGLPARRMLRWILGPRRAARRRRHRRELRLGIGIHQRLRGLEVEPADVLEVAVGVGVLADGAVPRLQGQDAAGQAALRVVEVADQDVAGRLDRRVGLSLGLPARPARPEPQPCLLPAPDEAPARDHAAALGVGVQRIHGGRVDGELQIRAPREALDQLVGALGLPGLVVHDRRSPRSAAASMRSTCPLSARDRSPGASTTRGRPCWRRRRPPGARCRRTTPRRPRVGARPSGPPGQRPEGACRLPRALSVFDRICARA